MSDSIPAATLEKVEARFRGKTMMDREREGEGAGGVGKDLLRRIHEIEDAAKIVTGHKQPAAEFLR